MPRARSRRSAPARLRSNEPPGASSIEAEGKFLIPGLIDAHVHLVQILASAHITGDEILPLFLAAGVTSVRDTGDEVVPETLVARFAANHPESCPRVFTCSPLIDKDPPFHNYESPAMIFGRALTDPAKVPAFVDDMAAWGVTSLKIYVGTPRTIGRLVIAEGHKHGLKVIGHLGAYSAQDAVADGIDVLEHIWGVWDFIIPPEERRRADFRSTLDLHNPMAKALIADLVRRGTMVDPTLAVFRNMLLLNDQARGPRPPRQRPDAGATAAVLEGRRGADQPSPRDACRTPRRVREIPGADRHPLPRRRAATGGD